MEKNNWNERNSAPLVRVGLAHAVCRARLHAWKSSGHISQ